MLAQEPGSAKIPSVRAKRLYAARICSSVTSSILPFDSFAAFTANSQLAGFPIRIAVAIVSGFLMTSPRTIAAAPSA